MSSTVRKLDDSKTKTTKFDKTKPSDIKEKVYNTKQVETSITILESTENDVVLEALLFLSKYIDINKNNSLYVVEKGVIPKLFKNFDRNICILRLCLRLLSILLDLEEGIYEIDQEKYDDNFIEITNMYIEHKDAYVKEFCTEILAKVAASCRINTLIFKVDLINPIFENIATSKNLNVLYYTLLLFRELIKVPAAISSLPESKHFDLGIIISHLNHYDTRISDIVLDLLEKLTKYSLPFLQEGFKKVCLVEKLLKIIMDENRSPQHDGAINIIHNCLQSEETNSYYIESYEFLELCYWIKSCHPKFLLPLIEIFITLSSIPEIKQILFDLSVEESILYFYRYDDKAVINKTCQAVSNMTAHKFCCEHMLTPVIAAKLLEILERQNDEEDPYNEVALKTVFHFITRNYKALNIFIEKGLKPILTNYFLVKSKVISEESFLMVLQIFYRCMAHPVHQDEYVTEENIIELFRLFQTSSASVATVCCEMLTNVSHLEEFKNILMDLNGPKIIMGALNETKDIDLITQILYFIFTCLIYEQIAMAFLHAGLIKTLRSFNDYFIEKIPLTRKVLHLALNYYPPLKFYETNIMEITDKLPNHFYVINGSWNGPFPFLEILEGMFVSPYQTIYLVDFSYEVSKDFIPQSASKHTLRSSKSSRMSSGSFLSLPESRTSSSTSLSSAPSVFDVNYGKISRDPFLPRYIHHIKKYEKYIQGSLTERIHFLAEYVDTLLCGVKESLTLPQKIHDYKLHLECIKTKLGNNIIPIGYLRLGFHCERALLFKALADKISIPCSLIKGKLQIYWNEVALFERDQGNEKIQFYVVDLLENVGKLMLVGSREANKYCNLN